MINIMMPVPQKQKAALFFSLSGMSVRGITTVQAPGSGARLGVGGS